MEKAVEHVESMFDKADADLKYLSLRLERQLDMEEDKGGQRNPMRLLKEIESVKAEYSNLRQEIAGIETAQKEAVDFLRDQLMTMSEVVHKLENQTGQQNTEIVESSSGVFDGLSQLLGVPTESLMGASCKPQTSDFGKCESGSSEAAALTAEETHGAAQPQSHDSEGGDSQQLSAAERREATSDFIEISEEEFSSVSELIRGRVKLEDLNRTYSLLWDHFKVENHVKELGPKDMNTMGLRVSGATGQAKLKILRALKLCKISKAGSVILS